MIYAKIRSIAKRYRSIAALAFLGAMVVALTNISCTIDKDPDIATGKTNEFNDSTWWDFKTLTFEDARRLPDDSVRGIMDYNYEDSLRGNLADIRRWRALKYFAYGGRESNSDSSTSSAFFSGLCSHQSLRVLSYNGARLTSFPGELCQCRRLIQLDLSDNQLDNIDSCIADLEELVQLDLSDNKLSKVPEGLGRLGSLQELSLQYNSGLDLAQAFNVLKNDTNLRRLRFGLGVEYRDSIPASLGYLRSLEFLQIFGATGITTFPDELRNLRRLKEVYLITPFVMDSTVARLKLLLPTAEIYASP
jgi:hypothetical protein